MKSMTRCRSGRNSGSRNTSSIAGLGVCASTTLIRPIATMSWMMRMLMAMRPWNARSSRFSSRTFAASTGGRAYFPRLEGELPELFQDISSDIRNQYTVSYSPTNTKLDGTYRKLKVQVVAPDGGPLKVKDQKGKDVKIEVVAREGYTAKHTVD